MRFWCVLPGLRLTWTELPGHRTAKLLDVRTEECLRVAFRSEQLQTQSVPHIDLERLTIYGGDEKKDPWKAHFYSAVHERELPARLLEELAMLLSMGHGGHWPVTLRWPQCTE